MRHRTVDRAGRDTGVHDHLVAFYDQDDYLVSQVTQFVLPALTGTGAAILIATRSHLGQFGAALAQAGVDVAAAKADGKLVVLDAAETLARFMPDGCAPDPSAFLQVVGGLMDEVSAGRDDVRAYGEMVALLWADGNLESAISLEAMWNDVATTRRFALLCGYPMDKLDRGLKAGPFLTVCDHHSEVIPNEAFLADTDWATQLTSILRASPHDPAARQQLDRLRSDFVAAVVDDLRIGLLQRGDSLLAEARKTLAQLDGALGGAST